MPDSWCRPNGFNCLRGARTPLLVYDFNKQPGKNFKVYYSLDAAAGAPCRETLPGIAGWVCGATD